MPKFESPIGNKQFPNQPMRDLSVTDDSGYQPPSAASPHRRRDHQAAPVIDEAAFQEFQARMQPPPPPFREISDSDQAAMNEILAAKKAKREGKERLSEGARRRIEMLIGMTRLTKDIEIGGQMYRIQTLTSQELRDAIVATAEFDGSVQFIFENRKQLLARSVTMVAGLETDQFLASNELEARLAFIELMPHELLLRLFNEYNSLAREAQDKYNPKTVEQIKEVVEDLKK